MISPSSAHEFPPCGLSAALLVLAIASLGMAFGAAVTLMACAPATL